ncbi:unnamed protein product [Rotaria sp. Silwood1]|nr:unnamed protein product [Rotaria sp. Silwood1]CAF1027402.1 unnamed protein product [Rotaria sp. Silwood1]CAF3421648.1 unnamed protein product [Rotaria sp. Silwood1]CAF4607454.1 unnamed protein product [Rotaria sp. Silwood1]
MISVLEDLPNELLLFIFHHLSIIDILCCFYCLNRRFSSLIQTIKHLHIDFSYRPLSKTQFIYIINQLHTLNIKSIRIANRYYIDAIPVFMSYILRTPLIDLRSLILIDADRHTIVKLTQSYPKLTTFSIESLLWRSMPRRLLPHFSNLTHCHLPILDLLNGCHTKIINLTLDHCTTDNLIQLNTYVPNLRSLTLTLNNDVNILPIINFPIHLMSLKLILRSVLFNEFERLIMMIKYIKNLTVSFTNTEHEAHCFDQYLSGEDWFSINKYVNNLQFNIIVNQTFEIFSISKLISNFNWFQRKIICQTIDNTNGYHLFTLPFIDEIYTINTNNLQESMMNRNNFNRVHHLHLTISNNDIQYSKNIESYCIYPNLQKLTIIAHYINDTMISFINNLMIHSYIQTLELRFTSIIDKYRDFFDKLIDYLPLSIHTLILNTTCTRFLSDLLDNNNNHLLPNIKRLICSVKNQDHFDTLILLLLEIFDQKSLIYLNISLENSSKSSNLLSGWLLKTNYLKKATTACSDRQCTIWF